MSEKLRIAVLFQSDMIPAWSYQMLSKINLSSSSEIVLLIKNTQQSESKKNYFVYDFYTKLDRKYFKQKPDAFELKSLKSLLDIKIVNDIDALKNYSLDIIIQLVSQTISAEILNIAKFGVWSYQYGSVKKSKNTPDLFWEVIGRHGEVGITLQMQSEKENNILARSYSLTDNLSVERSKHSYFWKAAAILPRKIEELYRLEEKVFFAKTKELNKDSNFFSNEIKLVPTNGKVITKLIKFKWKRVKNIIRSFFYFDQWVLLFHLHESEEISTSFSQFKKILPPKGKFWADPHIIKKNDTYYIFIEELIYSENKGFISVIEMDSEGRYKNPVKVIETDYHLSFPFIIEDNSEIYMIPESKQNNNIQLYKCVNFPYQWELEIVLMDNVRAVDTVITKKNGRYWLFTNMIEDTGASLYDELYLFYSDNLISKDWKSHPENPIVSDVKNSRLAGKIFSSKNTFYRPSQNCSNHYGYGMKINQIEELNKESYKEKTINSIFPDWDKKISATHSLTHTGNLTVIDAQYKRRK